MKYQYTIFDLRVEKVPPLQEAKEWLLEVCEDFNLGVREMAAAPFPCPIEGGHSYTVMVVLAESHAVIHTAPELSWIEVVFACCKEISKGELLEKVGTFFKPEAVKVTTFAGSVPKNDVI